MNERQTGDGFITGVIIGAFVGAMAATIALRRGFTIGPGSDERMLDLPPPDDATLATARAEAAAIVARLRRAFPNLRAVEG